MANNIWIAASLVLGLVWQVHGAVNCTATGAGRFAEPTDTTCKNYTYCVLNLNTGSYLSYNYVCPSTSLFNPNLAQCTANYVCPVTTTTSTTTTSTTTTSTTTTTTTTTEAPTTTVAPSVCTDDGYVANPNATDCSSYIECVLIGDTYIETKYDCPPDIFFNPNTTLCESDYNCTTTVSFSCETAGRFANTADTTCQTYYFCALAANDTYTQYQYTCPSISVFNPITKVCTTTYTCTG